LPSWGEIGNEITAAGTQSGDKQAAFDVVRKAKLAQLANVTGRPTIVYVSDFTNQSKSTIASQVGLSAGIDLTDKDAFQQTLDGMAGNAVDVVVHSPGGSAEAAESLVVMLRNKFTDVRFFVPSVAKSAATMFVLSGDRIVMDAGAELGPTDPQWIFSRNGQVVVAPLQSIRDEFLQIQDELKKDPSKLPAFIPIIQQFGPSLLVECDKRIELTRRHVAEWLERYMFAGTHDAAAKAKDISEWLADDKNFLTHARRIGMTELRQHGLIVDDLDDNPELADAVRSVYYAIRLTFLGTGALKIIENSQGQGMAISVAQVQMPTNQQPLAPPGSPVAPAPVQALAGNRAERRRVEKQQKKGAR